MKKTLAKENISYSFFSFVADAFRLSKQYKKKLFFFIFLFAIGTSLTLLPIYIFGLVIDDIVENSFERVIPLLVLATGLYLFGSIISNLGRYYGLLIGDNCRRVSRIESTEHVLRLDLSQHEESKSGKLVAIITKGADAIRTFFYQIFQLGGMVFFQVITGIILIFTLSVEAGAMLIAFFIIHILITSYFQKRRNILQLHMLRQREEVQGQLTEYLYNIPLVKYLNIKSRLLEMIDKKELESIEKIEPLNRIDRIYTVVFSNVGNLVTVAIVGFLGYGVYTSTISVGAIISIFAYTQQSIRGFVTLTFLYRQTEEQRIGVYRLKELLDKEPEIEDPISPQALQANWENINFNNITFTYKTKTHPALENVNIDIQRGEKIAIVGKTGSGKSTIVKLLMRAYLVNEGNISIGNTNIKDTSAKQLYDKIKIVPQDYELLDMSVKENITLGIDKKISDKEAYKYLSMVAADDFVTKLPDGIHTRIGEKGIKLSGGEKQRLCLARALMCQPEILVLDEATSSLDLKTEREITDAILNLPKKITLISITHRLTSIKRFDKIFVLHHGKLTGSGAHHQLLRSCKEYKQLWQEQQ